MLFEDEGHGFTKYSNPINGNKATAEFLVNRLTWYNKSNCGNNVAMIAL